MSPDDVKQTIALRVRLRRTVLRLGLLELEVLVEIAERIAAGQERYGPLTLDKYQWLTETYEELVDAVVYLSVAVKQRRAVLAEKVVPEEHG